MSEFVRNSLERMLPELDDLKRRKIFTVHEIRAIVKARTNFEYALQRRQPLLADFMRYVEHEMNVEFKRRTRIRERNLFRKTRTISDWSIVERTFTIFLLALKRFPQDIQLWIQVIDWAIKINAHRQLARLLPQALRAHPLVPALWVKAAQYEYNILGNMDTARTHYQRALRLNSNSLELWYDFFRTEMLYIGRLVKRKCVLGAIPNQTQLQRYKKRLGAADNNDNGSENSASIETRNDWNPETALQLTETEKTLLSGVIPKALYTNASRALHRMRPLFTIQDKLRFLTIIEEWRNGREELGKQYFSEQQRQKFHNQIDNLDELKLDMECLEAAGIHLTGLYETILSDIFQSLCREIPLCTRTVPEEHLQNIAAFWDCYSRLPLIVNLEFELPIELLEDHAAHQRQVAIREIVKYQKQALRRDVPEPESDDSSSDDASSDTDNSDDDQPDPSDSDESNDQITDPSLYDSHPIYALSAPTTFTFPVPPSSLPSFEQSIITRYLFGISLFNEYHGNAYLPSLISQLVQYLRDRTKYYIGQYQASTAPQSTTANTTLHAPSQQYYNLCFKHAQEFLQYSFAIFLWAHSMQWLNASLYYLWIQSAQGVVQHCILLPQITLDLPMLTAMGTTINPGGDINDGTTLSIQDAANYSTVVNLAIQYLHSSRGVDEHSKLANANEHKTDSPTPASESHHQHQVVRSKLREELISHIHMSYINQIVSFPSQPHDNRPSTDSIAQFRRLYISLLIFHSTHIHHVTFPTAILLWESFAQCHVLLSTNISCTSQYQHVILQGLNQSIYFHAFFGRIFSSMSNTKAVTSLNQLSEAIIFVYQCAMDFCYQHKVNMLNFTNGMSSTAANQQKMSHAQNDQQRALGESTIENAQGLGIVKLALNKFKALIVQYCTQLLPSITQSSLDAALDGKTASHEQSVKSMFHYEIESDLEDDDDSDTDSDDSSDDDSESDSDSQSSKGPQQTNTTLQQYGVSSLASTHFYTSLQLIRQAVDYILRPNFSPHAAPIYTSILDLEISLFYNIIQQQFSASGATLTYQQLRVKRDQHLQSIRRVFTLGVGDVGRRSVDLWLKYLSFLVYLQKNLFKFTNPLAYRSKTQVKLTNNDYINEANDPNNMNLELQQSILQEITSLQQNAIKTLRAKYKASFIAAADAAVQN